MDTHTIWICTSDSQLLTSHSSLLPDSNFSFLNIHFSILTTVHFPRAPQLLYVTAQVYSSFLFTLSSLPCFPIQDCNLGWEGVSSAAIQTGLLLAFPLRGGGSYRLATGPLFSPRRERLTITTHRGSRLHGRHSH